MRFLYWIRFVIGWTGILYMGHVTCMLYTLKWLVVACSLKCHLNHDVKKCVTLWMTNWCHKEEINCIFIIWCKLSYSPTLKGQHGIKTKLKLILPFQHMKGGTKWLLFCTTFSNAFSWKRKCILIEITKCLYFDSNSLMIVLPILKGPVFNSQYLII